MKIIDSTRAWFRKEGFVRTREGKVLGGVIAGLGQRLGMEPWPARLLFVVALLLIPGSQFLVYPVLWILMPLVDSVPARSQRPMGPATGTGQADAA